MIRSADYYEPAHARHRAAGRRLDRRRRARRGARRTTASGSCSRTTCARRAGFAYLHAARRALLEHLDVPPDATPRPLDGEIDLLADALRAAAPASARGRRAPQAVLLTDGEHNSAYWEHAWLARQLGIPLVQPSDLELRDGRLWLRRRGVRERAPVDVVYRRTNADRLDSDDRRAADRAGPRAARSALVNQFGTGVADDKLTHAYVEDMIRFYVGEEPVLRSVPTYDLAQPAQLERGARRLRRAGAQAAGRPRRRRRADRARAPAREDIDATREAVIADPGAWIAQRLVMLSTHPTVVEGGRLAPRHIDLRPFVFLGEGAQPARAAGRADPRGPLARARWSSTRRRTAAPRTPGS